ncbi:MAG TPA: FimV/HubP family polar landmark protein, partial [Burkholderiales bacterium]|nr:FimV/HubP family polar landmark protein [Burkholderiales bacterium]
PQPPVVAAAPAAVRPAAPAAGAKEYGPIQRGETLGKIAKSVMPEGVTLEQMLVGLYRSNPDAFVRKNLNLVRAGKVLRVPEREEIAAIPRAEAAKEFRAHVADWNAYRQKLADAAGTVPAEGRTAVSGKIAASVQDKAAAGEPKDVVRVSKGEPPGAKGAPRSTAERIRTLEEEVVAREKALAEANERIAQLEKTIKEMQKLIELKSPGLAAAQQQAQQAVKPEPAPAPKPEAVAAAKPEPAKPAEAPKPEAAKPEPAKPEAAAAAEKPAAEAPKPEPVAAPEKKAASAPKPAPPPPEPELLDQIIEAASDPLYLAAGGGVIVLGGLAFWMARRRRAQAEGEEQEPARVAPSLAPEAPAGQVAAAAAAAAPADEVDPLAEAEVYIAYGRDAQAEEILKEALAKNPAREDVQLKLLEIYSARKDKQAFEKLAAGFHKLTGGSGENWLKVAAMGYALDPANALYEAGKAAAAGAAVELDLDLGLAGEPSTTTDITLEAGAVQEAVGTDTAMIDLGAVAAAKPEEAPAGPLMPDFELEIPPAGGEASAHPDIVLEAAPAKDENVIDFQIELPKVEETPTQAAGAPAPQPDAALDFKLEVPDLDLGGEPKSGTAGGEKDGHWYDVQTKFDLAKAYQEMGDKDGAKEILQEVLKEGDAEQKAQAKSLLDSLG